MGATDIAAGAGTQPARKKGAAWEKRCSVGKLYVGPTRTHSAISNRFYAIEQICRAVPTVPTREKYLVLGPRV